MAEDKKAEFTDKKAGEICETCKSNLVVQVKYGRPVGGKKVSDPVQQGELEAPPNWPALRARVFIEGPEKADKEVDSQGSAKFDNLVPGEYKVTAVYDKTNTLVDVARSNLGSRRWAVHFDRSTDFGYGLGTNKCNLFVYDMTSQIGSPPLTWERYSWKKDAINIILPKDREYKAREQLPPLAGDHWANSAYPLGKWKVIVVPPEPGDVVAASASFGDASGHVGILSYPQPNQAEEKVKLVKSNSHTLLLRLPWRTVYAHEIDIRESAWPYRKKDAHYGTAVFRRFR